jgi:hypothetical protein
MATVQYDLEIRITTASVVSGLSSDASDALFRRPKIDTVKAKEAGYVPKAEVVIPATEEFTLEDISTGYEELIQRADTLLDLLKERVGGLTLTFDPKQNPELGQAVADIFQGETSRVTYAMYLEALRLDKDIAIAIGEASHGLT